MSVGIHASSRILVQGITGKEGLLHTGLCLEYGTNIVAGVTPGREGARVHGVPVYDTVHEAKERHNPDTTLVFVPPIHGADALLEAIFAGIKNIVCITEGIPVQDMMKVKRIADTYGSVLLGPNCPGIISPEEAKAGIMPAHIFKKGSIGVISRSGTLLYEAADQIVQVGLGISTALGIGGDPITGTDYRFWLEAFENDIQTEAVLMIGEIGGTKEEDAAVFIKSRMTKPVIAFIAGRSAPSGKRMGHAGAIINGDKGTVASKERAFDKAGVEVIQSLSDIGGSVRSLIHRV